MSFAPLRHVMVIFSLALFIVFGIQIFEAYAEKTKWYAIQVWLKTDCILSDDDYEI